MALVLADRVRETSTTTGTGTFTLAGAVTGFQSFSAIGTGNTTYYTIAISPDWEVGIGTWTSPNQLSRDTVLASTNGGAKVDFAAGTKDVFVTLPSERALYTDAAGNLSSPPAIGGTTPSTGKFTTLTTTSAWTGAAISDPAAPASNNLAVYAKNFGGYTTLAARNALNSNFGLQAALWQKSFMMFYTQSGATAPVWLGAGGSTVSVTPANVTATIGSTLYQTIKRASWTNAVTTTNQSLGTVTTTNYFFRGSVAGQGGFFYFSRFGFDTWTNGGRLFAGLTSTGTAMVTTDPSGNNNCVGFCVDAADNGAISFLTRGTAATKASTGLTIVSNKGYDCYIYCGPNSSQYTWQIVDINTGTSVTGTATLNLPTNTQVQAPAVLASNAALTTAGAVVLSINKVYVETDY